MYHYTECGLPNVWLENGFIVHETPYGKAVSVEDADGLHRMLAKRIASKKGVLSGPELRFLRTMVGVSQRTLGQFVGVKEQTVSLWERKGKLPKSADMFVRVLVLGKLDGDSKVGELLERVTTVDRIVNQKIVARELKRGGWRAEAITEASDEVAPA